MAENVSFASNGDSADGYLALPPSGSGPGLIVVQEWWGVNPQIKAMADRFAGEGFVALCPDLYHGELATHDEMDKATHLMNTLPADRAARDMLGAVDYLLARDEVTGETVGVIGFCMGGMLTMILAGLGGDKIGAACPYYGAPVFGNAPDWNNLSAPISGHYAGIDDFFGPDKVTPLYDDLRAMGKDVTMVVHEGAHHAFANEENADGYDKDLAEQCLAESVAFLKKNLQA
ncbi:MAG TPA: dienelactone hydrolase family protein [Acidimicrobiales bacterium]|nr:dienelactone hydrolase family protein [Acidimicrobiales bacterium]